MRNYYGNFNNIWLKLKLIKHQPKYEKYIATNELSIQNQSDEDKCMIESDDNDTFDNDDEYRNKQDSINWSLEKDMINVSSCKNYKKDITSNLVLPEYAPKTIKDFLRCKNLKIIYERLQNESEYLQLKDSRMENLAKLTSLNDFFSYWTVAKNVKNYQNYLTKKPKEIFFSEYADIDNSNIIFQVTQSNIETPASAENTISEGANRNETLDKIVVTSTEPTSEEVQTKEQKDTSDLLTKTENTNIPENVNTQILSTPSTSRGVTDPLWGVVIPEGIESEEFYYRQVQEYYSYERKRHPHVRSIFSVSGLFKRTCKNCLVNWYNFLDQAY